MSVGPPGGKGMTSLRGLDGYLSCARTAGAAASEPTRALAPISNLRLFMASSQIRSMGREQGNEKRRASLPAALQVCLLRPDGDGEARRVVIDNRRRDVAVVVGRCIDDRRGAVIVAVVPVVVVGPATVGMPATIAP